MASKTIQAFRAAMTKDNLIKADSVATVTDTFVKIGEYKVEAGEMISVGYGGQSGQDNAQGRLYIDLKNDANANVEGYVRLHIYDPQNHPLHITHEFRTEQLRTNKDDRTKQIPFPEHSAWIEEDKKLVLEFCPDAAGTVNKANSYILMDITRAIG